MARVHQRRRQPGRDADPPGGPDHLSLGQLHRPSQRSHRLGRPGNGRQVTGHLDQHIRGLERLPAEDAELHLFQRQPVSAHAAAGRGLPSAGGAQAVDEASSKAASISLSSSLRPCRR
jgi:hypothetical protein